MTQSGISVVAVGGLVALLGFWGYCLVDFVRTPEYQMRTYSRATWVLLLVFTSVFGGALWLMKGRPRR